ncbi:hypothetical protein [Coleofasciculus sp. H7-2]
MKSRLHKRSPARSDCGGDRVFEQGLTEVGAIALLVLGAIA